MLTNAPSLRQFSIQSAGVNETPRAHASDSSRRSGSAYLSLAARFAGGAVLAFTFGCSSDGADDLTETAAPLDPSVAPRAEVDRFSEESGTLQVRTEENGLPEAGEPVDFDQPPFVTHGLGPDGERATYYNFDVQPAEPAPIYVLFRQGEDAPVGGQLNIIDAIPGDPGYNDFWQVHRVTVDEEYEANSFTSFEDLMAAGLSIDATETLVNCPVVPEGSTATQRLGGGSAGLTQGWYRGQVAHYFSFEEQPLTGTTVGAAPIFVTFNTNPGEEGGGPPSGFVTEMDSDQTHNVLAALPGASGYSPLWSVNPYDNADFASVGDLASAEAANVLDTGVALVNCPVVDVD